MNITDVIDTLTEASDQRRKEGRQIMEHDMSDHYVIKCKQCGEWVCRFCTHGCKS